MYARSPYIWLYFVLAVRTRAEIKLNLFTGGTMTVPSRGNAEKQAEDACPKCHGSGRMWTPCDKCKRTGIKDGEECPFCDGHGGHDDPCPNCQLPD